MPRKDQVVQRALIAQRRRKSSRWTQVGWGGAEGGQQGPRDGGGLWGLSCGHGGAKIWVYRGPAVASAHPLPHGWCWPDCPPNYFMPALCSTFSESCGHLFMLSPHLLPAHSWGSSETLWKSPTPAPHPQTCLHPHAQSANCTDLAQLNLEIKSVFLSKMKPSDCPFIYYYFF